MPKQALKNPRRPRNPKQMVEELGKPLSEFTDGELADCGRVRVSVGPFGLFGTRIMTIKRYNQREAAKSRARERRKAKRKAKRKQTARRVVAGKPKKHKKSWLGGLLYWD